MGIEKRLAKIEKSFGIEDKLPEWAIRVAEGYNRLEPIWAKMGRVEPVFLNRDEILEEARKIFKEHGAEEAYLEYCRNYRLPERLQKMLDAPDMETMRRIAAEED